MRFFRYLHPLFFSLLAPLSLYSSNVKEVPFYDFVTSCLWIGLFVVPVGIALWALYRDGGKAILMLSLLLFLFFSYGHLYDFVSQKLQFVTEKQDDLRHRYMLLPFFCVLCLSFVTIWLKKSPAPRFHAGVTFGIGLVVLFSGIQLFLRVSGWQPAPDLNNHKPFRVEKQAHHDTSREHKDPDIYYLIFDRYARGDVLKQWFDYDNDEFYTFLETNGFYVASKSFANYSGTLLSLASSLNMQYLDFVPDALGREAVTEWPINSLYQEAEVIRFLKRRNYTYIHIGTWFEATRLNRYADETYNYQVITTSRYKDMLLMSSLLQPFLLRRINSSEDLKALDSLVDVVGKSGPKFVLGHFLFPHPPYFLDAEGGLQPYNRDDPKRYLEQLSYTTKRIREIVEHILRHSDRPPVILLQSDEGPYSEDTVGIAKNEDEATFIHSSILNAYYLPGIDKTKLYKTVSPVNSFRLVFDHYFGSRFGLLDDKAYCSPRKNRPYDYEDITDIFVEKEPR